MNNKLRSAQKVMEWSVLGIKCKTGKINIQRKTYVVKASLKRNWTGHVVKDEGNR